MSAFGIPTVSHALPSRYYVFKVLSDNYLSHNGKDKPAVETIGRLLRDEYNLKAWLDKWNLIPGEAWQEGLENALDECQTYAVFLGPSGIGPWENEEMRSAIEERVQDKNRRVIPVLLPDAPDNKDLKLPRFLRRATWVDFRSGLDDKEALYRLYCGIKGITPGDRGSSTSNPSTLGSWHLKHRYGLASNFTGRVEERKFLTNWLENNDEQPLLVLRALGGFGKSALTWFWLTHDVNKSKWAHVVWWSFYDDPTFESFAKETLESLRVKPPQSAREQVDMLLKEMERQNILLVMDGFERGLRAFSSMGAAYQLDDGKGKKYDGRDLDCISPNAEEFLKGVASSGELMKGKVLMTTRLTPRVLFVGATHDSPLQGMLEKELFQMESNDAVDFFLKQGVRGTRPEIQRTCSLYGYHPLSLRLLAGLILKDKRQPMDIAAASRYEQKVATDARQRQHHVLEQSYTGLSPESKALLGRIACFRSSVPYDTLVDITKDDPLFTSLDDSLDDLISRGLLHCTITPKADPRSPDSQITTYDLHPIVRRFAYDQLTAPERTGVHVLLVVYFQAVPPPPKVQTLEDLAPVIELYHHMVRAENLDEACDLYYDRLGNNIYFKFGIYQLCVELLSALFSEGEDKPPRLKKESDQAWTLNGLANAYSLSGQPRRAFPLFEMQIAIREKEGNKKSVAIGLGNVADDQLKTGALSAAERNLRRSIDLGREITDEFSEAIGHRELGRVLSYRGAWQEAEQELDTGLELFEKQNAIQSEGVVWSYRALRFLLMARETVGSGQLYPTGTMSADGTQSKIKNLKSSIESTQRALELADETTRTRMNVPSDYVRAYWLLGAAYRANNELALAEENLSKALNLCRRINSVEAEADILLDLARLRYAQGDLKEAQEKASEALVITERSGYVLQGADVNLFLAELTLTLDPSPGGRGKARQYAEEARKLARCDDGPPYYYKVAYEEAERMLEQLAQSG